MRKTILGSLGILLLISIACNPFDVTGSGTAKTENREAKNFTAIDLSGVGKVIVEQTGSESLNVTADDNILPLLETTVTDGTLHLRTKSGSSFSPKTPIEFKIEVKDLSKLTISGAGDVVVKQLKTDRLEVTLSGAGNMTLAGSADELKATLSGAGKFDGEQFKTKHAAVTCSGVGNAVVHATDSLDAKVSGVGSIEYLGSPEVKQSVSGVGSVKKR